MKFSIDFFQDEERCGFYIPTAIKQAWAVGLTILSEIDRICKKYKSTDDNAYYSGSKRRTTLLSIIVKRKYYGK